MVMMVMVVMAVKVVIRPFHKNPFVLESQDAQSGFLVHGSIEANVRKCDFSNYVSFL